MTPSKGKYCEFYSMEFDLDIQNVYHIIYVCYIKRGYWAINETFQFDYEKKLFILQEIFMSKYKKYQNV